MLTRTLGPSGIRESGIENRLEREVREGLASHLSEDLRRERMRQIQEIINSEGLIGRPMMEFVEEMQSKNPPECDENFYDRLSEIHEEALDRLLGRKQEEDSRLTLDDFKIPEEEDDGPDLTDRGLPKDPPRPDVVDGVHEVYHPDKPEFLKDNDYMWPVHPDNMWKRDCATRRLMYSLMNNPLSKEEHRDRALKVLGCSEQLFDRRWERWTGKKGLMEGWRLQETPSGGVVLRPFNPIEQIYDFEEEEVVSTDDFRRRRGIGD